MDSKLTNEELQGRLERFTTEMNNRHPSWDTAIIMSRVNQYYFTGTMQDGMLVVKRDGSFFYFARRSFERARDESPLAFIYPMESYRDAASIIGAECGNTYIEAEVVTVGIIERLKKHLKMVTINSLDRVILSVRSVKTLYELDLIKKSGQVHQQFLQSVVPTLLRENMSEADFVAELYERLIKFGYQGICRFSMFQTEMLLGQVGFGESSIYPTSFDGPGGAYGMSAAVPLVGSRERRLKKGDLVFVDIGYGINGYQTDKTQVYMFGGVPSEETVAVHRKCIDIQKRTAELLVPGAIPSEVYQTVMSEIDEDFLENFMGFGKRQVKFLGHGVGLHVDEYPIIANGFKDPIKENMIIALEPKKGIKNVGMVGVEDTYLVTADECICLTGGGSNIIVV